MSEETYAGDMYAGDIDVSDMISARDAELQRMMQYKRAALAEYHSDAKLGIMRTTGVSSDEYDAIAASDPSRLSELQMKFLSTI